MTVEPKTWSSLKNDAPNPSGITLREVVEKYGAYYDDDLQLIQLYISKSHRELEAISLITKITQDFADRVEEEKTTLAGHLNMIGMVSMYEYFPKEIASKLEFALHLFCAGNDLTQNAKLFMWLQTTIPTLDMPKLFYEPFSKELHRLGIYFKGESRDGK